MKLARTSLAALAALILLIAVGASPASGSETTLCSTNEVAPYCEPSAQYSGGTAFTATSGEVTFTNPTLNSSCKESTISGETTAGSGNPLPISVSSWTFGKCSFSNFCKASISNLPHAGTINHTENSDGTLTFSGGSLPLLTSECFGFYKCNYSVPPLEVTGGSTPTLAWKSVSLSAQSGSCPATNTIDATYTVSTPTPAYVSQPASDLMRLCKAAEDPCSAGNSYAKGTTLNAAAPSFVIKTESFHINCGSTTMETTTDAIAGNPLPVNGTKVTPTECSMKPAGKCTVTPNAAGWDEIWPAEGYDWLLFDATIKFACGNSPMGGPLVTCTYGFEEAPGYLFDPSGETPAQMTFTEIDMSEVGGKCPSLANLTATFSFTSPSPLYFS